MREAIVDGPGAPGRLTLFTGTRGVGKTVMLNEVENVFDTQGWLHVSETASPGLLHRILRRTSALLRAEEPPPKGLVTGIRLPGGSGADFQRPDPDPLELREVLERLTNHLGARNSGLLVTVDEVHGGDVDELRQLAVVTQHLIREDREFAVCMAGLPSAISSLLNDEVLTFLRRADKHVLGSLDIEDVEDAFAQTFGENGRSLDHAACRHAAAATKGYPYLVQLVGHEVWRSTKASHIDQSAVERAIDEATSRLATHVHEPALRPLSDVDIRFLVAMAQDSGASRIADVARRLDRNPQYVNTYRRRLIAGGLIEPVGRGRLAFAIPYLEDSLRRLDGH